MPATYVYSCERYPLTAALLHIDLRCRPLCTTRDSAPESGRHQLLHAARYATQFQLFFFKIEHYRRLLIDYLALESARK